MRLYSVLLLAAASVLCLACEQPQAPRPPAPNDTTVWEEIDLAPGTSAWPTAISEDGTIVGGMVDSGVSSGFVYKDGVLRRLAGAGVGMPQAISPSGKIVGRYVGDVIIWDSPDATPRQLGAGLYDVGVDVLGVNARGDILTNHDNGHNQVITQFWRMDVPQNIGYLADSGEVWGKPTTYASAWNSSGQIVGESKVALAVPPDEPPWNITHPFIWEDGVMRDLGVLAPSPCPEDVGRAADCAYGTARGINERGVIVGYTTGAGGLARAFVWENGVMRDLGAYPGRNTSAQAINDRGQILGRADTTAFLWDNGQVQVILTGAQNWALTLGANGEVVGSTFDADRIYHTFIWQAGELTELGIGQAVAMNGRGEIIGVRYGPGGGYQAILWRKKSRS